VDDKEEGADNCVQNREVQEGERGGGAANGCVHSSVAHAEGSDTCVSQYEERVLLVLPIQVML
jgi:hypothetical protein